MKYDKEPYGSRGRRAGEACLDGAQNGGSKEGRNQIRRQFHATFRCDLL